MDHCAAFIHLYREEVALSERTAPWIERVGVDYIRSRIAGDEIGREALRGPASPLAELQPGRPMGERVTGRIRTPPHIARFRTHRAE